MNEVVIENVSFSYGRQTVLKSISFEAEAGEFVCLLGPSGCGKSTLLRLLAGLDAPTRGRITVGGNTVTGPGLDRSVVFQDYSLFPWMTTGENIILALEQANANRKKAEYREIAREHLSRVGLLNSFDKLPSKLSGGMRQRAAIARAFAIDAPVLLMDEPFGALDAVTRTRLQDLLLRLWRNQTGGKTVFFVTHDIEEAMLLADKIVVLGLTPGPAQGIFTVDIPRPRSRRDIYSSEDAQTLRNTLVSLLYESSLSESEDLLV
ncbi:ABC transporter ATP-binding protein [Rhodomicrobium lacus]|uniref:ABC transporter ATP-binding protein n=1 Tax=Rhodomicrobium lacus TaxID=2498452 RepID=UPI0026E1737D|nr:ABC transporter ATP-binding protein [Rhodomicrobium lacus]WKW50402.1 ABC transporter ATP-binding protein [Rhodomicrobium lacus]